MQLHFWNLTISNLGGISCESEKTAPYNAGAIIMLIVWSLIALTVFGATIFHWVLKQIKNRSVTMKTVTFSKDVTPTGQTKEMRLRKTVIKFILAFSLYKTIPSILSTKQYPHAITSLNGIRVISMFWVILGHTLLWTVHFSNNSLYVLKYEVPKFTFQANISAPFAVDTFFLLSGVLVAVNFTKIASGTGGQTCSTLTTYIRGRCLMSVCLGLGTSPMTCSFTSLLL